jgi:hypothetical protein
VLSELQKPDNTPPSGSDKTRKPYTHQKGVKHKKMAKELPKDPETRLLIRFSVESMNLFNAVTI